MNSIVSILGYVPKKIGVFKTASLADLPHDLCLFQSLQASFPEASLVWISSNDARSMLQPFSPAVSDYLQCPDYLNLSPSSFSCFTKAMQQQKWDVIIQLDSYDSLLNTWIETWNPKLLIGYSPSRYSQCKHAFEHAEPYHSFLISQSEPKGSIQSLLLKSLGIPAS